MSQNKSDHEKMGTTGGNTGSTGSTSTTGSTGSTGSSTTGGAKSTSGGANTSSSAGTSSSTGASGASAKHDDSTGLSRAGGSTSGGGAATGTATGLTSQAKEYGQKVADVATQAKDYLSDKASVVGDKFQDLKNADYQEMANNAKDYARQNPGQALLISAAAGFVLGLLLRGGRRS